jgi:hypothetical protein
MKPWERAPGIGGRSLLDIYAMIAGMHAENQLYLSRTVLAYALGCEENDLDRGPLRVLRREAMVDGSTAYVLTRHRRIAEVARDWLIETGYDVDQWYPLLAGAALSEFKVRRSGNPDINRWQRDLAQHFADRGPARWPLARAITKALFTYDPDDAYRLTSYASMLRRTGQPGEALTLMREHGHRFKSHRGVLFEWSVAAGSVDDDGLAIWLAARSVADDHATPLTLEGCKLSLAGLGAAFREIAASTGRREFAAAQAACGHLGLRLAEIDPTTRKYFEEHAVATTSATGNPPSLESDIATLTSLVVEGSYEAEPENSNGLDALIGEADSYRYKMLASTLSAGSDARRNSRH